MSRRLFRRRRLFRSRRLSKTSHQEYVVPRSIPITVPSSDSFFSSSSAMVEPMRRRGRRERRERRILAFWELWGGSEIGGRPLTHETHVGQGFLIVHRQTIYGSQFTRP